MPSELTTVATYRSALEAHAAKNLLEENEIRAFIADENFSNLNYGLMIPTKIQVASADVERAKELLAAIR